MIVSRFNSQITLDFLQKKRENQYFERKGMGEVTGIHEKNVKIYLNQFIDNEKIIERLSDKQRDRNAKYAFKKH